MWNNVLEPSNSFVRRSSNLFLLVALTSFFALHSVSSFADEPTGPIRAVAVETLADDIDGGTGGLVIDGEGNVYTADFGWTLGGPSKGGDKIFKVDPSGSVELFCRQMRGASGNTIDSEGNLYQSSIGGNFISKVTPDGEVSVFCREGVTNPVGLTLDDSGNLFVANCGSNSIQKITPDGTSSEFCKSELLKCPNGIAYGEDGNLYVANFSNGDVVKIDEKGDAERLATLPGNNNGHLVYYRGFLYVVARTAHQIYEVSLDGKTALLVGSGDRGKQDGEPLESSLSLPNDLGISPDGKFLYINETGPTEGDPRVLGPTRIRRVTLREAEE